MFAGALISALHGRGFTEIFVKFVVLLLAKAFANCSFELQKHVSYCRVFYLVVDVAFVNFTVTFIG